MKAKRTCGGTIAKEDLEEKSLQLSCYIVLVCDL